MLSLNLLSGEYIMIGEDIVVQVFRTGDSFRVAVEAPRALNIVRGEVFELAGGERPECIRRVWRKPRSQKYGVEGQKYNDGFKRSAQAE